MKIKSHLKHLSLSDKKPLPSAFLALDILPPEIVPFDAYYQDRFADLKIEIPWRQYKHVGNGDREMKTTNGRTTEIRVKMKVTSNHPTKPTRLDIHVVDLHKESAWDYTAFAATKVFSIPIKLAANEYFVKFHEDTFSNIDFVADKQHGWVFLVSSGIARKVQVKFDGRSDNDHSCQGLKATLKIPYQVFVHVPNPMKINADFQDGQG